MEKNPRKEASRNTLQQILDKARADIIQQIGFIVHDIHQGKLILDTTLPVTFENKVHTVKTNYRGPDQLLQDKVLFLDSEGKTISHKQLSFDFTRSLLEDLIKN